MVTLSRIWSASLGTSSVTVDLRQKEDIIWGVTRMRISADHLRNDPRGSTCGKCADVCLECGLPRYSDTVDGDKAQILLTCSLYG